jgi:hypothetical protein
MVNDGGTQKMTIQGAILTELMTRYLSAVLA